MLGDDEFLTTDRIHPGVQLLYRHAMDLQVTDHVTAGTQFPKIVSRMDDSDEDAQEPLLGVQMAMPPLDNSSSLSLRLRGRPLRVVANLPFLLGLSDFFAVQPVNLHALEDAMINALGNARQQSSAAIADALDAHKSLDIDIKWLAPKILLPADCTSASSFMAVVDLGHLKLNSAESRTASQILDGAPPGAANSSGALAANVASSTADIGPSETHYDQLLVSLQDVKLLLAQHGHSARWTDVGVQQKAHLCLLEPVDIDVGLFFCIGGTVNDNDANMLLDVHLHPVTIAATTTKIRQLLFLADSVSKSMQPPPTATKQQKRQTTNRHFVPSAPKPKPAAGHGVDAGESADFAKHYKVPQEVGQANSRKAMRDIEARRFNSKFGWVEDDIVLANRSTSLAAIARIDGFTLAFARDTCDQAAASFMDGYDIEPVLNISVLNLTATYTQKTFAKNVTARLGSFFVEDCLLSQARGKKSFILNAADTNECLADITGTSDGPSDPLMDVSLQMVDPLDSNYLNVPADMVLDVSFRALTIVLNQEPLARVILVFAKLAEEMSSKSSPQTTSQATESPAAPNEEAASVPDAAQQPEKKELNPWAKFHCNIVVSASLKSIGVVLNSKSTPVLSLSLDGFGADVSMCASRMDVAAWLTSIKVVDLTLRDDHAYRTILAPMFVEQSHAPVHAPRGNVAAAPGYLASRMAGRPVNAPFVPRFLAVGLTMFDETCPHYQGYSLDVTCDVATLRCVVLFRYIDEVSRYFLEGELMQALEQNKNSAVVQSATESAAAYSEQLSEAANKGASAAYNATLGVDEQASTDRVALTKQEPVLSSAESTVKPPSSSLPRLRVVVASQVIVVPIATESREHVELRMAQITVCNVLERDLVVEAQVDAGTGQPAGDLEVGNNEQRVQDAQALSSLKSLIGLSASRPSASSSVTDDDDDFESVVSNGTLDTDADYVDAASTVSGADYANFADFDDVDFAADIDDIDAARCALYRQFERVGRDLAKLQIDFDGFSIITGMKDPRTSTDGNPTLLRNFVLAKTGLKVNVDTTSPMSVDVDLTRVDVAISPQQLACCLGILSHNLTEKGKLTYDELQIEERLNNDVDDQNAPTQTKSLENTKRDSAKLSQSQAKRDPPSTPQKQLVSGGGSKDDESSWVIRPTLSVDVRLRGFAFELVTKLDRSDDGVDDLPSSRGSTTNSASRKKDEDTLHESSLARLSCGNILVMFAMYNTGGVSTGMKLNLSLAHITLEDTRQQSANLEQCYKKLLEIRSHNMPYAFTMTFSQGKVLHGSSVKKYRERTGVDGLDFDMRVNLFLAGIRLVALEHAFALLNYVNVLQRAVEPDAGESAEIVPTPSSSDTSNSDVGSSVPQDGSAEVQSNDNSSDDDAQTTEPSKSPSIYVNVHIHKPTIFLLQDLSYDNPTALALSADLKLACSILGPGSGPESGTHVKLLLQNVRCHRSSVKQYVQPDPHDLDLLQPLQGTLVRACHKRLSPVGFLCALFHEPI